MSCRTSWRRMPRRIARRRSCDRRSTGREAVTRGRDARHRKQPPQVRGREMAFRRFRFTAASRSQHGQLSAQPRRCRAFQRRSLHNPIYRPSSSCIANRWFVEFTAYALASRLRASRMEARATKAPKVSVRFSKSLARRRLRPNQEKVRSTTRRRGRIRLLGHALTLLPLAGREGQGRAGREPAPDQIRG